MRHWYCFILLLKMTSTANWLVAYQPVSEKTPLTFSNGGPRPALVVNLHMLVQRDKLLQCFNMSSLKREGRSWTKM